jgi:hypothetical protein
LINLPEACASASRLKRLNEMSARKTTWGSL